MKLTETLTRKVVRLNTYIICFILILIVAFTLSSILLTISFNKPIGDDYSFYNLYHTSEWVDQLAYTLETMNGRYAQNISAAVLYRILGMNVTYVLPSLVLLGFLSLAVLTIHKIIPIKNRKQLISSIVASLIFLTALYLAPGIPGLPVLATFQNLFWSPGIITYSAPFLILVASILGASSLLKHGREKTAAILYFIAVFTTGLFNELQPASLLSISAIGLTLLIATKKTTLNLRLFIYLLISSTASGLALITIYLSNANQARRSIANSAPIDEHTILAICNKFSFALGNFLRIDYIIMVVFAGIVIHIILKKTILRNKTPARTLLLSICFFSIFIISLLVTSTLVTIGYGENSSLLNRTLLLPQITFAIALLLIGFTIGQSLKSGIILKYKKASAIAMCGLTVLLSVALLVQLQNTRRQVAVSVSYMNAWITQDTLLKKASLEQPDKIIYLANPATGIGDGYSLTCTGEHVNDTNWLNIDIQKYYNLNKICTREDLKQ